MYRIQTLNKISRCGLEVLPAADYEISGDCAAPDGIILRSADMHKMELPDSLKAVARAGAGVNNIPLDKCAEKGIVVFNTPGANANAVKELVVAGLMLTSRKIAQGVAWAQNLTGDDVAKQIEGGKAQFGGFEIMGKKLGVIGLGAIGAPVANAGLALGMEVLGYDPFFNDDIASRLQPGVKTTEDIDKVYETCDYISIHVPFNADTRHMFNKDVFTKFKKGVRLLNFARGELVDNADVKEALASGLIACYITDFPTRELLNVEGVVPVPHLGASTEESEDNCARMAATQLKSYLETGNIVNSVNFPACELPVSGTRVCVISKGEDASAIPAALAESGVTVLDIVSKTKKDYAYTLANVEGDAAAAENALKAVQSVILVRLL